MIYFQTKSVAPFNIQYNVYIVSANLGDVNSKFFS